MSKLAKRILIAAGQVVAVFLIALTITVIANAQTATAPGADTQTDQGRGTTSGGHAQTETSGACPGDCNHQVAISLAQTPTCPNPPTGQVVTPDQVQTQCGGYTKEQAIKLAKAINEENAKSGK